MSFYPTRPGVTRPIVNLPSGYRERFVTQCVKRFGMPEPEAQKEFEDMVDMITECIPTCATPENVADAWIAENAQCA